MKNGTPKVRKQKPRPYRQKRADDMLVEHMAAAFYRKINPRREQEIMDARLIQEDHDEIANLSREAINKQFNASRYVESLGRSPYNDDPGV